MSTQHELIVRYLTHQAPKWVPGFELNRVQVGDEYLSHNASRRARELAMAGSIEHCTIKGVVHYRVPDSTPTITDVDGKLYRQAPLPLEVAP